ncbi:ensconsin isoform X2 [Ictalurus punctatus]|uniref:Ensconsin isoform X2 n=1 Tax=Ictalurus punctatus TaxID=7998 RepID=A0A9F7RHC2_ICTPU|nr:ensconsin isoform X2 [Ictalurus punctatus]
MLLPPRLRKGGSRSVIPSLTTITEEDEEQRSRRRKRRRGDSDFHHRGDEKKPLSRPDSTVSAHNTYIISSSADVHNAGRPEPLVLKPDERQKLARERREEREKQNAVLKAQLFEREERARLYYEKQLEDRRRRLEEQRLKEERRRVAVEEKRRQKLEEEKARYEAVVRRTLEKSQRVRPKQNRWSWGATLPSSTSHNTDADRRSVSTMNLSKHIDPVINKRLSSSSATLLNSPDRGLQKQTSLSSSCLVNKVPSKARVSREKIHRDRHAGMRRMPLTPWENNVISRLQTPTHSYLARSRSAVSLSGDAASCHHASSLSFKAPQSRSGERPIRAGLSLERAVRAGPEANPCRKASHHMLIDRKDKDYVRKSWSNLSCPPPTLSLPTTKRAPSPGGQRAKLSQQSSARSSTKPSPKSPMSKRSRSPPPPSSLPFSPSNPSLLPGNLRPSRVTPESPRASPLEDEKDRKKNEEVKREETRRSREEDEEEEQEKREKRGSPAKAAAEISTRKESNGVERVSSPPAGRPSTGTTDPEEASRLLAEKRRQAREQREKEEEEKKQQEEAERRHREEMAQRIAEERAKREEEAQRLAEEKKRKEEEERQLEEERLQREKEEEAERLQRQKEEEEARQREEAERLRQEREKHFQKEEAERLERKKRLEEIMKRTRRSDQKSPGQRNGDVSQQSQDTENVVSGIPSITVSAPQIPDSTQRSDSNGHTLPPAGHDISTEAQLQENGVVMETPAFEEVIEVPMVSKLSRQEGDGEEEDERRKTPQLAFSENGSTHDLSTWDQSQVRDHAGDV